jgi:hypothetical protein
MRVCHYSILIARLQAKGLKNIGKSRCRTFPLLRTERMVRGINAATRDRE